MCETADSLPRVRPIADLGDGDAAWAGSKCVRLARLMREGLPVPRGVCVGAEAYHGFVEDSGLWERVQILLHRKRFEDLRWEEIWDLALRIRNLFLRTPFPAELRDTLAASLTDVFAELPVVVRSTAPGEDSGHASFAGLHDSFVNVRGTAAILDHVKLVWASLWSDRALLYRRELGLDPRRSAMAVAVQEFVHGRASGVAFTRGPADPERLVIEAVWGLNQGLVDGSVAPDRWHVDRHTLAVTAHDPAERELSMQPVVGGVEAVPLPPEQRRCAPLEEGEVRAVARLALRIEELFANPQDVEWTLTDGGIVLLQARPITTADTEGEDQRRWYLTLHRSLQNLKDLERSIEQEILPGMARDAEAMRAVDLSDLDDASLAAEVRRRREVRDGWVKLYWRDCIPFAHGVRLFGQVYNDRLRPADPFEFINLLHTSDLAARARNEKLRELAALVTRKEAGEASSEELDAALDAFLDGHTLPAAGDRELQRKQLISLLTELAGGELHDVSAGCPAESGCAFLAGFEGEERQRMEELLRLARASYRLRDDDNVYLGRVEAQLQAAAAVARRRLDPRLGTHPDRVEVDQLIQALEDPTYSPETREERPAENPRFEVRARQLVGQPAGPGLAVGPARVIVSPEELFTFRRGEVLVCDAVNPNMTFIVPLAAAIVERRGGMLIHGAIIAREYGVPCVTGVPDATRWIRTGDRLSIDGHLGIVTLSRS